MIKVSVFYPRREGATFDMGYYCSRHIPMVRDKLGEACKGAEVDQGMAGGGPDAPPSFVAMGHLLFDSVEAFQASFGPHAEAILGDVPNYTNIEPVIQISEIKLG